MSDFAGMQDLLQDFLVEAEDLLSGVDNRLVELEKNPHDKNLLNEIFRGFHTIKGGAGFLGANELVTLCHLTENLFDKLRNDELSLTPTLMDLILEATAAVRDMFVYLERGVQPPPADESLLERLRAALSGKLSGPAGGGTKKQADVVDSGKDDGSEPDWELLHQVVAGETASEAKATPKQGDDPAQNGKAEAKAAPPVPKRASVPAPVRRQAENRDQGIRIETSRLDQVLNLAGEIGLTKNRLTALRSDILAGKTDPDTLHALDVSVNQLDLLVSDLQNAVMKTRMQPIGRLFQKYPRIARDLARQLGKQIELVISGEETEIDKTMIDDLSDPLIHLIRNAVDHGIESPEERVAAGKKPEGTIQLSAKQEGDHILIIIADDGKGMSAEKIRAKAVEKGLISADEANGLDDRQSLNLIFLPGFSTAEKVSDVSGRGVGMDVVRTNITKLNGTIDVQSEPGRGTTFIISLPLTLAILPVLLVRLGEQPFAVPLSMVREILPIHLDEVREVGGRSTLVVRGEVLPILPLSLLLNWPMTRTPSYGVLMQMAEFSFILGIDSFAGREDAVIKSLEDFRPKGVAGVTILSNGQIVLILDMKELFETSTGRQGVSKKELEKYAQPPEAVMQLA
ncbi:chemotaxis protein CheA [Hydrogenophilus thiooxidans]|uniref:chemotaxis protein CheA n=1 Tax=Hydrogenophilus thiooxidans TaxID=2820326 RepID=UPI001C2230A9|nr:chemotaxis protein CheA [Hydrogenophilus thiooxidans]